MRTATPNRASRLSSGFLIALSLFAAAGVAGVAGVARAQDEVDVSGVYTLSGGWFGDRAETQVLLRRTADGNYEIARAWTFTASGEEGPALAGSATVDQVRTRPAREGSTAWTHRVRLQVELRRVAGAANRLDALFGGDAVSPERYTGTYWVYDRGASMAGRVRVPGPDGATTVLYETGERSGDLEEEEPASTEDADVADDADADEAADGEDGAPRLLFPDGGTYLVGQLVPVRFRPSDAGLEVLEGAAAITSNEAGTFVRLEGPGKVVIRATRGGDETSAPSELTVVTAEPIEVTVADTIALEDAPPPHFARARGAAAGTHTWEPAAILKDRPLRLQVVLELGAALTRPTRARLVGTQGDLRLAGEVRLQGTGASVVLASEGPLTDSVAVNALDLAWTLQPLPEGEVDPEGVAVAIGTTPLRVYTLYRAPVDNPMPRYAPSSRQGLPLRTKLHMELACAWAEGASQNVGGGPESIAYKIDNNYRNHVAWVDYGPDGEWAPPVPHYPKGTPPPLNYDDLEGYVFRGHRAQSYVYYPSADDPKPYADYRYYANNFGWWVLDNPTHTGGRCNQQASLICDVLGTVGIRAEVYYIERTAVGARSGRPLRRYYKSSRSTSVWNFHGQAEVQLEDGTRWLYDGTGSRPPDRINGRVDRLMAIPGPYIDYWQIPRYDDRQGGGWFAPMWDWPDTWSGVPIQPGEAPLDKDAPDGTYSVRLGRWRLPDGSVRTFYAVNVNQVFVSKLDEPKATAETYDSTVHGAATERVGD